VKFKGGPLWLYLFGFAVTVNAISLVVMVQTLAQIADLQIRHERQDLEATLSERHSALGESRSNLTSDTSFDEDDRLDTDAM
jgi:hypothetical protein